MSLLEAEPVVRLLGPYDLLVQGKDRDLLVPEAAHRKQLWPALGRPGPLLADGEIVGCWRPRAKGAKLDLEVELWQPRGGDQEGDRRAGGAPGGPPRARVGFGQLSQLTPSQTTSAGVLSGRSPFHTG